MPHIASTMGSVWALIFCHFGLLPNIQTSCTLAFKILLELNTGAMDSVFCGSAQDYFFLGLLLISKEH